MKKPRIYSPLDTLPLSTKQVIMGWLTTGGKHGQGLTYEEACNKLKAEFGIETQPSSLSGFFKRHRTMPEASVTTSEDVSSKTITITISLPK